VQRRALYRVEKIISNKIEIIKKREITARFVMIFSGRISTGRKK
jgi:hypothetical protein